MTMDNFASRAADDPEARHRCWQERRMEELSAPDSWLGLVGLFWLEPGKSSVGSGAGCAIALPAGPAHLGDLYWEGESVLWRSAPGSQVEVLGGRRVPDGTTLLHTDRKGEASRVRCGDLEFFVIERDGRPALRLRDLAWRGKRDFTGLDSYPFDPSWRLQADWEELAEPWSLEVQSVTGELKTVRVPARVVFRVDGTEHALLPLEVAEDGAFFIFRDATSGRETYGGGRFLRIKPPVDGKVVLDFNQAFNPPCAFTPYATCSLAPPENRLPFPVRAGEKKYAGYH